MTLPPAAWIMAMSPPKLDVEMGSLVSPSQYAVQEPAWAVWRKANDRYLAPDCWDRAARPPLVL